MKFIRITRHSYLSYLKRDQLVYERVYQLKIYSKKTEDLSLSFEEGFEMYLLDISSSSMFLEARILLH
ncbi:hypothetical protein BpHYR1_032812 [Brachionus plicatilis]|uniref:Uncharacterized protein n=1 Tax=Brachionus plicatilis TaxID=10195 RepID=A0A3M7SGR2_BRAPC|nr:hypothetical protein BpHYR1_032812 [Brachionus plicatilis]